MVRPATKMNLDVVARHDPRFKSEADVVRHLLETYLPAMAAVYADDDDTTQPKEEGPIRPRRFNGGRPVQVRREDLESLGVHAPLLDAETREPIVMFFDGSKSQDSIGLAGPRYDDAYADDYLRRAEVNAFVAADVPPTPRTPCSGIHNATMSLGKLRCTFCGSEHRDGKWMSEAELFDAADGVE